MNVRHGLFVNDAMREFFRKWRVRQGSTPLAASLREALPLRPVATQPGPQDLARPVGLEPTTPGLEGPTSGYSESVIEVSNSIAVTGRMPGTFRGFYRTSDQAQ